MPAVSSFRKTNRLWVVCLFVLVAVWGCGEPTREPAAENAAESTTEPDAPDSLVLYSIDGEDPDHEVSKYPESVERFHGYPVLGKTEIGDRDQRQEIVESVELGITSFDGYPAKCFWPRHGLRITQADKTIDYVICFECNQVKIFRGDEEEVLTTAASPQTLLNTVLQDANIEFAPGMKVE
jgi:hypothetical protein